MAMIGKKDMLPTVCKIFLEVMIHWSGIQVG